MAQKPLPEDFRDFIESLNSNKVEYILIGGWAVGLHGNPRTTKDIDFLVEKSSRNIKRLQKALYDFGAPPVDEDHFKTPGNVYRMGRHPMQIDVISHAIGIDTAKSIKSAETITVDNISIKVISFDDLIESKKATGRLQDLADVEKLIKIKNAKKSIKSKNNKKAARDQEKAGRVQANNSPSL
jgi:predicted nucleotidyltransferase